MNRVFGTSANLQTTPVIIPARNEVAKIGRTLDSLASQSGNILPLVIVNGADDGTADIARGMGATVLESAEGKMPAVQTGLEYLGKQALEPFLILDADTMPFTKYWSNQMSGLVLGQQPNQPALAWGPYVYKGDLNPLLAGIFTATTMRVSWQDRHAELPRTIRGGNTALFIKNSETLEEILALDNFWPREDVALYDVMKKHSASHSVSFHPDAWALTSGSRLRETMAAMRKNWRHPSLAMDGLYAAEAPPGSRPYNSETTATVRH